jgi:hypothetical protein
MQPDDLLRQAADLINTRGQTYGDFRHNLQLAADISSLRLGRPIHPYEVATILVATKNARAFVTPSHEDSHIDAAVYEIFAQVLAPDYENSEARQAPDMRFRLKEEQKPAEVTPFKARSVRSRTEIQSALSDALGRLEKPIAIVDEDAI